MKPEAGESYSFPAFLQELTDAGSLFLEADLTDDSVTAADGRHLQNQSYSDLCRQILSVILTDGNRRAIERKLSLSSLKKEAALKDCTVQGCFEAAGHAWIQVCISLRRADAESHLQAFIMMQDVTAEVNRQSRDRHLLELDCLTGLYQRGPAEKKINDLLAKSSHGCAFIMTDLDDLKKTNDRFGHCRGDQALKAVAAAMRCSFRRQDVLARLGGDEFIAFLPGDFSISGLSSRISAFLENVQQEVCGTCLMHAVHCSAGCVISSGDETFQKLYEKADQALYQAKSKDKGAWSFYVPNPEEKIHLCRSA